MKQLYNLDYLENKKVKTYLYVRKKVFRALQKKADDMNFKSISQMLDFSYDPIKKQIIILIPKKNKTKKLQNGKK